MPEVTPSQVLAAEIPGPDVSVREYLRQLLTTLWEERDEFSGKRPFGNSGWEYDVYLGLVKAGLLEGKIDEDGYLEDVDAKRGHQLIKGAIQYVFAGGV